MRIVCPACSAAYDVPETLLRPGRSVRCARCGERFAPLAAREPPPAAPADLPPEPPADLSPGLPPDSSPELPPDFSPGLAPDLSPGLPPDASPLPRAEPPIAPRPAPPPALRAEPPLPRRADPPPAARADPPLTIPPIRRPPVSPLRPTRIEPPRPATERLLAPVGRPDWAGVQREAPLGPTRRAGIDVWLGWLVSLAVLAALGWAAYAYRAPIMQIWPPSQRVYNALGLTG